MAKKKATKTAAAVADTWELNDPAHNQTWLYLFMTREILTNFPDSAMVTMSQMAWWNPAASPAVRRIDAEKKAIELYRFFADAMKRPFEEDYRQHSFANAIPALANVLVVKDNTIPAIAGTIDEIFQFEDEDDQ